MQAEGDDAMHSDREDREQREDREDGEDREDREDREDGPEADHPGGPSTPQGHPAVALLPDAAVAVASCVAWGADGDVKLRGGRATKQLRSAALYENERRILKELRGGPSILRLLEEDSSSLSLVFPAYPTDLCRRLVDSSSAIPPPGGVADKPSAQRGPRLLPRNEGRSR
jgi:hypothetical protein